MILNESEREEIEGLTQTIRDNIDWAKKQVEIAYSSQEANVGEQTGGTEDAGTGKDD